jgi:hypothetical protein
MARLCSTPVLELKRSRPTYQAREQPPWPGQSLRRRLSPVGFLRRLDDRVIGQAERDPATRRSVDAWANALLLLIGGGVAIAVYFSERKAGLGSPAVYVLIGVIVGGALLRIARSRGGS